LIAAVSDPAVNADQRFPLIAFAPVTGTPGAALSPGKSGLAKTSYALLDFDIGRNRSRFLAPVVQDVERIWNCHSRTDHLVNQHSSNGVIVEIEQHQERSRAHS
jgi:hypothetical protein